MRKHTRAGLAGVAASSGSTDHAGRNGEVALGGREEVAAEAVVLAGDVRFSVAGSATALGASSNTLVGVDCLRVAGAWDPIAASYAATVVNSA